MAHKSPGNSAPCAPEPPTGASSVPLAMAEPAPDIDLFRAGPVRYLGYSNEAITARRPPNGRCERSGHRDRTAQ